MVAIKLSKLGCVISRKESTYPPGIIIDLNSNGLK
jgi:hypothetical protein